MEELWKDIPGFPGYRISNYGRVESCRVKGKTGWCNYNKWHAVTTKWEDAPSHRYVKVRLNTLDGKRISFYLHRLLYECFIGPIPEELIVDHADRNSLNNTLSNLRLATRSQNSINSVPRTTSGVKGVYRKKSRWVAAATFNGKTQQLGSFILKVDAIRTYNNFIYTHYKEFANLNSIPEVK